MMSKKQRQINLNVMTSNLDQAWKEMDSNIYRLQRIAEGDIRKGDKNFLRFCATIVLFEKRKAKLLSKIN